MWKPFIFENNNFLYKLSKENEDASIVFTIMLTDCKNLWTLRCLDKELITKFKDNNPLYTSTDLETSNVINDLLNDSNNIFNLENKQQNESIVYFKSTVEGLPIKLNCRLLLQDTEQFYKAFTVPLIKTVQYLEMKHTKLNDLLVAKDKEISTYKFQFGDIDRKNVVTEKYVCDKSEKPETILNVFCNRESFLNVFVDSHGDIRATNPEIQEKKVETKTLRLAPLKKKLKT